MDRRPACQPALRRLIGVLIGLGLPLLVSAPLWAAETPGGNVAEPGMPQLNATTYAMQLFWLVIAFAVLFQLMRKRALPRVTEILEARQDRISSDLERAARLRDDAEAAHRRYEEVVQAAREKVAVGIREAQDRLGADAAQRQAELDADLGKKLSDADARIREARDQALREVRNVAVEVAQAAVAKLAGLEVDKEAVTTTLDAVREEAA